MKEIGMFFVVDLRKLLGGEVRVDMGRDRYTVLEGGMVEGRLAPGSVIACRRTKGEAEGVAVVKEAERIRVLRMAEGTIGRVQG